jgi:hypothetical protein
VSEAASPALICRWRARRRRSGHRWRLFSQAIQSSGRSKKGKRIPIAVIFAIPRTLRRFIVVPNLVRATIHGGDRAAPSDTEFGSQCRYHATLRLQAEFSGSNSDRLRDRIWRIFCSLAPSGTDTARGCNKPRAFARSQHQGGNGEPRTISWQAPGHQPNTSRDGTVRPIAAAVHVGRIARAMVVCSRSSVVEAAP